MRTFMHIWLKTNEKLHVRLKKRWRTGGLVRCKNLAVYIDPKNFYWERWPSRLVGFWKRGARGIDFIEGIVTSQDPGVLQSLPGTPERQEQDKRTSEILETILEEARTRRVFGGEKMDPMVVVVLVLVMVIAVQGVLMFMGLKG